MKTKLIFITSCVLLILFLSINAYAGVFNVGVIISANECTPEWHCTSFSKPNCGTRDCIDVNSCGINTNKPIETKPCQSTSGGSSTIIPEDIAMLPLLRLSSDIVKIDIKPDSYISKTIKIYSDASYKASIQSNNPDFIKISSLSKTDFLGNDSFDIRINTSGFNSGIYNGIVLLENDKNSESITIIINILSEGPDFSILLNGSNKMINASTILIPIVKLKNPEQSVNISYVFLTDKGERLFTFSSLDTQGSSSVNMPMPAGLLKGYYTLAVSVQAGDFNNTKYLTFYADPEGTLKPYVEETRQNTIDTQSLIMICVILILVLLIFLLIKNYALIKRKLGINTNDPEILNQAYEKGFISKVELEQYLGTIGSVIVEKSEDRTLTTEENIKEKPSKKVQEPEKIIEIKKELSDIKCPEGKEFILHDGSRMYSIKELSLRLESMDQHVFNHHVNPERNDFANWIRDVFKDKGLASRVRECMSKEEMIDELKNS